jgi:hypothetical protein
VDEGYFSAAHSTRRRRILRRAVIAVAVVVLLPVGYFLSVCSHFVANADVRLFPVADSALWRAYTMPVEWYINSELPGSDLCGGFIDVSANLGSRLGR